MSAPGCFATIRAMYDANVLGITDVFQAIHPSALPPSSIYLDCCQKATLAASASILPRKRWVRAMKHRLTHLPESRALPQLKETPSFGQVR